jgi:dipeptidyl aminopeptidase/acylaminoacyl peptidase
MRTRISFVTVLLFLFSVSAFAEFTVEQVMSAPFPSQLAAAKNSTRIVWLFDTKGERNLWTWDAASPNDAPRPVTSYKGDNGQPIASVRITPDGKTILYVRGAEVNGKGAIANPNNETQELKQQAWSMDADGKGEPKLLGDVNCGFEGCENIQISPDGKWAVWATNRTLWLAPVDGSKKAERLHYLQGNSTDPQWSPDGKQLAFVLRRGDHNFTTVIDIASKKVRYMAPSVDRDYAPRWSADSKQIAFLRRNGTEVKRPLIPVHPEPWSIWVADVATGTGKQIWKSGTTLRDSVPNFDETSFYFANGCIVFNSEHDGWSHLYSVPVSGGTPTLLTPGDFDVEDVALSPDRNEIVYSSNQFTTDKLDQDRRHLWRVNVNGGKPTPVTSGETIEWAPVFSHDGKTIYCMGSTATLPAMIYRAAASGGRELISKNALPAEFPADELVTPRQVIFKSEDGLTIHGQLFVPKNQTKPGPALIYTHGGPPRQMMLGFHYWYYYHSAYAANQYLASLGYTVLSVNYRLGIMYGRDFREPPNSVWRGSSEYKDVVAGARYLMTLPNVDKDRIGLWGGSYGGLLTALGLARNSDIFKAGVDYHGVHDWSVFLDEWADLTGGDDPKMAPDYQAALKLAWESSPNADIAKWKSPVLLIHGDDDRNVPFNQTTDLVQRLRKQGVEFEQVVYPDDIHDFLLWRNWVDSYKRMGDFFDRRLKGQ